MRSDNVEVEPEALVGKTIKAVHSSNTGISVGIEFEDGKVCVIGKRGTTSFGVCFLPPWDIRPHMQVKLGMATKEEFEDESKRNEMAERARYEELHAKYGGDK